MKYEQDRIINIYAWWNEEKPKWEFSYSKNVAKFENVSQVKELRKYL